MLAVVSIAALTFTTASCSSNGSAGETSGAPGGDTGPIIVYSALGISGNFAGSATALLPGMQAAVAEINDKGGLLGRKVELETANTQSDPTKAVSILAARLAEDPKPDLGLTGANDIEILPQLPVYASNGVMGFSFGIAPAEGDSSTSPLGFSVGPPPESQAKSMADYLESQGYKRIALLYVDQENAFITADEAEFTARGMQIVSKDTFPADSIDVSPQLLRIKDADADVIMISGVGATQYVLASRQKVGMTDIPMVGDGQASVLDLSSTVSPADQVNYIQSVYSSNIASGGAEGKSLLLAQLKKANVEPATSVSIYGIPWDAIMAWANAVTAAGSTDPAAVAAELEKGQVKTTYPYVNFAYSYSPGSHFSNPPAGSYAMIPIQPLVGGQFVS